MRVKIIEITVTYDLSELKELENADISSEEERKEIGENLMETIREKDGKECIKSVGLLMGNNMSYYVYKNEAIIQDKLKRSDNYSVNYALVQLVHFVYENHGISDLLPQIMKELLNIKDSMIEESKAYRTKLERVYDKDIDIQEVFKEKFGESFTVNREGDVDNGKRIELDESGRGGVIREMDDFFEFEVYERVSAKSIKSGPNSDNLYKSFDIIYGILADIKRSNPEDLRDFREVIDRIIDLTYEYIGDIGEKSFKILTKLSIELNDGQNKEIVNSFIARISDGFALQPNAVLLNYVIRLGGDIHDKDRIVTLIKNEYDIPESRRSILKYESSTEERRAYKSLGLIENIKPWKMTLIKLGFTQFYY